MSLRNLTRFVLFVAMHVCFLFAINYGVVGLLIIAPEPEYQAQLLNASFVIACFFGSLIGVMNFKKV